MKNLSLVLLFLVASSIAISQNENNEKSIPHKTDIEQPTNNTKEERNIFFWEDFDSGLMPPVGWNLVSGGTPRTWSIGSVDVYTPVSGSYFALCRYDETYNPEGQDEKLYTPVLNMTGLSDAKLGFWFLFSRYWGITPHNNYDLQVLVSTDGGVFFSDTIWTELSTDTSSWSSWNWVWAEADLTPYVGMTNIQLCFRYVGFDGADAAIDNVEISFLTSIGQYGLQSLQLYPNPAQDFLHIDGIGQRTVIIYDAAGKIVATYHLQEPETKIMVSSLPKGMYIVGVTSSEDKQTKTYKLVLQ